MRTGLTILAGAAVVQPCIAGTCCFSKWGDASSCGTWTGPGGQCNTDPTKTCQSNSDCPDAPAPTPTPPSPPTPPGPTPAPSPPTPAPPSPPTPTPAPVPPGIAPKCCYSKWGSASDCGDWTGPGARCNTAPTETCQSVSDCPAAPAPTPAPPPSPPGPSPPPSGPISGFWFGYAGSSSPNPAPSNGWFFMFPGTIVRPPFDPKPYATIMPPPTWGTYEKKILTQGGGDTDWGDSLYTQLSGQISEYKKAGWDGVCWDWEKTGSDHTSEGFNGLMRAAKAAGLINIVTSTAEGPYVWSPTDKDATGIDWSAVDYFVPQLYGADGKLSDPAWPQYASYWMNGAGKPNVHNVTFSTIPMKKFLWGMPAGECDKGKPYGGSGCVEWDYSPGVKPPPTAGVPGIVV